MWWNTQHMINYKYLEGPVNKCSALDYVNKQTESCPFLAVTEITSPSFLLAFSNLQIPNHLSLWNLSSAQSDFYLSIKMTWIHQSIFQLWCCHLLPRTSICFHHQKGAELESMAGSTPLEDRQRLQLKTRLISFISFQVWGTC